MSQIYYITFLW